MNNSREIREAVAKLDTYIVSEQYKGYDPYDALMSPLFHYFPFNNKPVRYIGQQIVKRLILDVRPLLGIPKGYNPVTLGLVIQGLAYQIPSEPGRKEELMGRANLLIAELERIKSPGYSGACWGYDFDWESRYSSFPAFTPTVVATGIITNGLFAYYRETGNKEAAVLCLDAVNFVRKDLNRMKTETGFCYSYSPLDKQRVYNATLKAARLLAQASALSGDKSLLNEARGTVTFVASEQRSNGSWSYSKGDARSWVDNFHTGYILDCLDEYIALSGDTTFISNRDRGFQFYADNFFTPEGIPKYYPNSMYPVDATAGAQAILTLTRFNEGARAGRVATWLIGHMQSNTGFFYYQIHRHWTNRTSYMRWSNAWMFAALSRLMMATDDLV